MGIHTCIYIYTFHILKRILYTHMYIYETWNVPAWRSRTCPWALRRPLACHSRVSAFKRENASKNTQLWIITVAWHSCATAVKKRGEQAHSLGCFYFLPACHSRVSAFKRKREQKHTAVGNHSCMAFLRNAVKKRGEQAHSLGCFYLHAIHTYLRSRRGARGASKHTTWVEHMKRFSRFAFGGEGEHAQSQCKQHLNDLNMRSLICGH